MRWVIDEGTLARHPRRQCYDAVLWWTGRLALNISARSDRFRLPRRRCSEQRHYLNSCSTRPSRQTYAALSYRLQARLLLPGIQTFEEGAD